MRISVPELPARGVWWAVGEHGDRLLLGSYELGHLCLLSTHCLHFLWKAGQNSQSVDGTQVSSLPPWACHWGAASVLTAWSPGPGPPRSLQG